VKRNAKDKEIKSAYRKLALKYHVSLNHYMSIVCCEVPLIGLECMKEIDAVCIMFWVVKDG
jgi:hypothetical protein